MRRKVMGGCGSGPTPSNWQGFPHDNKTDLNKPLAKKIILVAPGWKQHACTYGETVLASPATDNDASLFPSSLKEADTCALLLAAHGAAQGPGESLFKLWTQTLLWCLYNFCVHIYFPGQLCVTSGSGKHIKYIPVHNIANNFRSLCCKVLAVFHASTGCDTTSSMLA